MAPMIRRALCLLASMALWGCKDEPPFVPFDALCTALAEDVCQARTACCQGYDAADCATTETAICTTMLVAYEAENGLVYDARGASNELDASREELAACGPAPSLAAFFTGGLGVGAACERDAQCATGACTGAPRVCTAAVPAPLCPAP